MRLSVGSSGSGKRKRSPKYPCVTRFRQRRLLTFLAGNHFLETYRALVLETNVCLSVAHLQRLVEQGLWDDAIEYLSRFVPPARLPDLGVDGRVLLHFLRMHKGIADIVAGSLEAASVAVALNHCLIRDGISTRNHAVTKLRGIFSSLLLSSKLRASLDWGKVRFQASRIVTELAFDTPEFKDLKPLSARGRPLKPQNVLPIGFGLRRRRHVKKQGRTSASVLAGLYLQKQRSLPPSSYCQELTRESLIKAKERMVDLVDISLQAGKGYPPRSVCNKGAPGARDSQPMFGTFIRPVKKSRYPSMIQTELFIKAKEWVVDFTDESLEACPDLCRPWALKFISKEGMNKHLSQEGCHTESARQGFESRKHPRTELTTVEQDLHPIRQRTTGAFGETSLAPVFNTEAEAEDPLLEFTAWDLSA